MWLTRRATLRAGGLALLGGTSLAGCTSLHGRTPDTPRDWQYDPGTVSETPNTFFGTAEYGRLYRDREHLPESVRRDLETSAYTPLDAEEVRAVAGVGGVQTGDYGTGSITQFGSVAFLGSFGRGALEKLVRTQGTPDAEREYRGFTLYEGVDGEKAGGLRGVPGDRTPFTMTAVAVGEGAMVVGSVAVRGRNSGMVFADNVVEATVDAATGNGPRLYGNDRYADRLADAAGESTVIAGLRTSETMLRSFRGTDVGAVDRIVAGLRAAGLGLTVDGATSTVTLVGLYEDATAAEATGAVSLIEGVAAGVTGGAVESLDATFDGAALVVTVEGETGALLDGTAFRTLAGPG